MPVGRDIVILKLTIYIQMYGATAVLESRISVMQGDKVRMLTYVSMAYLPITTVAVSSPFILIKPSSPNKNRLTLISP